MRVFDRNRRVTVVPYQKSGVPDWAGLTVEQCEKAAWAVEPGEVSGRPRRRWRGAGAINASLAVALGVRLPLSFYELSGINSLQERVYDLVVANRDRIPGEEPHCDQHPEECR